VSGEEGGGVRGSPKELNEEMGVWMERENGALVPVRRGRSRAVGEEKTRFFTLKTREQKKARKS